MRNFDWIFDAEGKVAEGKACVYCEPLTKQERS